MKLSFSPQDIERAPKSYARVEIAEGGTTRLVEKDGVEVLQISIKKQRDINRRKLRLLSRQIIQLAKQHKLKKLAIQWNRTRFDALADIPYPELAVDVAAAFEMANYEHTTYKTKPKEGWPRVEEVLLCGPMPKGGKEGYQKGQIIGQGVNACRELANTPGGDMTPVLLAQAAKAAARSAGQGSKLKVTVLGRKEMQKLGMGGILGVAKGSAEEPQFIVMEYKGGGKEKPVVLIGKGVTFDTGGLQVKTGDGMYEMHMDMSGGASVIHAVALAAKLALKVNVVGLVPAVENSPSGSAMRPGDILRSLSGKTIEILHTDAEGRVILADAISYAKRYDPKLVAEVSTLTGASLIALGMHASAFMTNEKKLRITDYLRLAEESGDYLWPLPAWEEYEDMTKGHFGDVPNISTAGNSRYGGVIAGGMFLKRFFDDLDCPWVHIDMAPRMTAAPGEHLARGAAGAPVRFLLALIKHHAHPRKD